MFKWIDEKFNKFWDEWFSFDDIELLDDAYMDVNRVHEKEEDK